MKRLFSRWTFAYAIKKGWGMTELPCGCINQYINNGLGDNPERGFKFCRKHKKEYPYYKNDPGKAWLNIYGVVDRNGVPI